MTTIFDTNIILRFVTEDIFHSEYDYCIRCLQRGGVIPKYVIPEVVFNYAYHFLYDVAVEYARLTGEIQELERNRKLYIKENKSLRFPGWKKKMYRELASILDSLLQSYPGVEIEDMDQFREAMRIAIGSGLDWVDCMLIAESCLHRGQVATCDKAMLRYLPDTGVGSEPVIGLHLT